MSFSINNSMFEFEQTIDFAKCSIKYFKIRSSPNEVPEIYDKIPVSSEISFLAYQKFQLENWRNTIETQCTGDSDGALDYFIKSSRDIQAIDQKIMELSIETQKY